MARQFERGPCCGTHLRAWIRDRCGPRDSNRVGAEGEPRDRERTRFPLVAPHQTIER